MTPRHMKRAYYDVMRREMLMVAWPLNYVVQAVYWALGCWDLYRMTPSWMDGELDRLRRRGDELLEQRNLVFKSHDEICLEIQNIKRERDELLNYLDAAHCATCNAELRKKRNEALIELQKMREEIERKSEIVQELVEARDMALDEIESLMARNAQWATIARRAMVELDKARKMR